MSEAYGELRRHLAEAATLASTSAVLSWDQETFMPAGGAQLRADQIALLAGLVHERRTAPRIGDLLALCEANPELRADPEAQANLRGIRRDYDRAVRLPTSLIREIAETSSLALEAWKDARARSDFAAFTPWLDRTLSLMRTKTACLRESPDSDPYDALLDEYEPGGTARMMEQIFRELRPRLISAVREIAAELPAGPDRVAGLRLPIPAQQAFSRYALERIGFNLEAGRLDVSAHPFCEGVGPGDTRLTSRYREDGFLEALGSALHEGGHGLYEQGLPKRRFWGQPLGEAAGLGIHESQSRLWENMVGRSRTFWHWAFPEAHLHFGSALDGFTAEQFYRASNAVRPGPIRVEADEITYNLHILLRFDLERALLADDLRSEDLPAEWNRRMAEDLGVHVPDDARGCLQDVHWSMGAFGYFPTYTLGNVYAAQFWEAALRERPAIQSGIGRGEFEPLLSWLRENVHAHGRRWDPPELCAQVTGSGPDPAPLLRYLEEKARSASAVVA